MAWIAGVDGCKGGWIAVYEDTDSGKLDCRVGTTFDEVMTHRELDVVAVDMPIGLCDGTGRACDAAARAALRPLRHSSIFSAPAAGVIDLYRQMTPKQLEDRQAAHKCASDQNEKLTGKGLTQQAWGLVPKISELDWYLAGHVSERGRIYEVHPEVSFAAMNALQANDLRSFAPMKYSKKTSAGRDERRTLLSHSLGRRFEPFEKESRKRMASRAAKDDLYDALACLWTARRIHVGARSLPEPGCTGRMRIVY